jgi:hypothetical protein
MQRYTAARMIDRVGLLYHQKCQRQSKMLQLSAAAGREWYEPFPTFAIAA